MEGITEDVKKKAFEMKAELRILQLQQLVDVINLSSKRGAFSGNELSVVGTLHDNLSGGVEKAIKIVRDGKEGDVTDEDKKKAFDLKAELRIFQLFQLLEIINLASKRGAFAGNELSVVGNLYDTLNKGVDQAFKLAKEKQDLTIVEEPSDAGDEKTTITSE